MNIIIAHWNPSVLTNPYELDKFLLFICDYERITGDRRLWFVGFDLQPPVFSLRFEAKPR
jgi:hypothetical protein